MITPAEKLQQKIDADIIRMAAIKKPKVKKSRRKKGYLCFVDPGHMDFAAAYVRMGNAEKAATECGYNEKYGTELLKRPDVQREIARHQEQLRVKTGYDLQAAFDQTQRLLSEAEVAGQYMAASRFLDMAMRLHGLLIERTMVATVDMRQALEDSRSARNPELESAIFKVLAAFKPERPLITIKPEEDIFDDD